MEPDQGFDWRGPFDGILKRGILGNCAVFVTGSYFDLCLCRAFAFMGIKLRARGHALWRNRIDHGVRLWGLYFIEFDHLNSTQAHRVFLWGCGHIAIFHAGTLIAAGSGAHIDVLTDHSKIDLTLANAYVGAAVAIYVLGLWAIRDHFGGFGRRGVVLLISGPTLIAAAFVGAQPWTIAIILVITLGLRIKLQETQ